MICADDQVKAKLGRTEYHQIPILPKINSS